uniref:Immunoglobulin domain-containing protein n=1 Tax=Stegastes partitus TaxID=144197 RepID=A0A3B4ZQT2_9TELE
MIFIFLAGENTAVTFTAYRGGSVTVNCTYPRAEASSVKLFYRDTTSLISSFQSQHTKRDRFSLTDDRQQGVYTVIISSLNESDAGKYWCAMEGVNDNSTTCLTEILLRILSIEHLLQSVQITCPYPKSHEGNEKFLCKGENPLNCEELIQTTKEDNANKGRFSIRDNQRLAYFYVYINHLTEADSGTYWCGSGRTMQHDEYTKIHLSVGEYSGALLQIEHILVSFPLQELRTDVRIVGVGLCLVLLVALSVVVLIVYRRKCLKAQAASVTLHLFSAPQKNNEDHNYEEIQLQNQAESSPTTVYATVSLPADLLHYSSVTFHKNGNSPSDTDINGTALDATHPPAAEQTLYSTVRKSDEEQ